MSNTEASALAKLKSQRDKLQARIQAMEAREKVKERKAETRRKILIGAYYWDKAKAEQQTQPLIQIMATYLTRDSDRQLFGLPPLASGSQD